MTNQYRYTLFLLMLSTGILLFALPASGSGSYEAAATLRASQVLPQEVVHSKSYSIEEKVENDGFTNTYTVSSNNGKYTVRSNIGLFKLLLEIEAIEAMQRVEQSDVFVNSLKASGDATVEGIKKLVTDPGTTLQHAATGLSSLFGRAEESLLHSTPGDTEDSRVEQTIGFSQAKREIAYRYHVDVYSRNQLLQQNLDRIAWADYAGGITLGAATMPIGGLAGGTLTVSGTARILGEAVATSPPAELKRQNRKRLDRLHIDPALANLFIENPHYSPLQQTAFVMALEKIQAKRNVALPLHVAVHASNPESTSIMTSLMLMLSGYDKNITPVVEFRSVGRIFCGVNEKGTMIVTLPADHVTWNRRLAGGVASIGNHPGELWITGTFSDLAKENLQKNHWTLEEKVAGRIGFEYK